MLCRCLLSSGFGDGQRKRDQQLALGTHRLSADSDGEVLYPDDRSSAILSIAFLVARVARERSFIHPPETTLQRKRVRSRRMIRDEHQHQHKSTITTAAPYAMSARALVMCVAAFCTSRMDAMPRHAGDLQGTRSSRTLQGTER